MSKHTVRLVAGIIICVASATGSKWGCLIAGLAVFLFTFPFSIPFNRQEE